MANNYTLFSTGIENLTDKEKEWTIEQMEHAWWCDECDKKKVGAKFEEGPCDVCGNETLLEYETEYGGLWPDFDWKIEEENFLWIYSEEGGNVDSVIDFMTDFLKEHRPDDILTFSWANICGKPRIDEFNGGYAAVASWGKEIISWNVLDELVERLRAQKEV